MLIASALGPSRTSARPSNSVPAIARFTNVFLYIICILFFVVSCSNHKQQNNIQGIDKKKLDESLENVNRIMIQHESDMIDEYVRNNNLRVIKTGTGLRYYIKNQGEGRDIPGTS